MKAEYITVLDTEIGKVFRYNVKEWDLDNESCEDFLSRKGHNLSNCQWMVHSHNCIITNNSDGAIHGGIEDLPCNYNGDYII